MPSFLLEVPKMGNLQKSCLNSTSTLQLNFTDINQTPEEEIISTSKIRLDLVFENGNWMVDDFTDYNKVGELYESDSRLYRKGIDEALEYFQESN